jgi:hypothetical protein
MELSGATATEELVSDAPDGFRKSKKAVVTTAFSPSASEYFIPYEYRIEGQDLQQLKFGVAAALGITLSFWIKSSKAATYAVELVNINTAGTRSHSQAYSIDDADTWEKKELFFDGDTVRAFEDGNRTELTLFWWMCAGTTFTSGALNTSWGSQIPANRADGIPSSLANNDEFSLTGVQLELGDTATPFEHRSYGDELARCQRYYYRANASMQNNNPAFGSGYFASTTVANLLIAFPVTMRVPPTALEQSGSAGNYKIFYSGVAANCSLVPYFEQAGCEAGRVSFPISSGGTVGLGVQGVSNSTTGYLGWSAEL